MSLQLILLSTFALFQAATYNWDITYVKVNPTGTPRRAIGVNGAWPPPPLEVLLNDTFIVNVKNSLDIPTALHAHGLFHNGTSYFDGAAGITQCPIPPGANFTYTIPIKQHGTYWFHAHLMGQYIDGLRTSLILRPPKEAYTYDEEYIISLSDWYNDEHSVLIDQFLSVYNPIGIEPVPNKGLINHKASGSEKFKFVPGKTYRLRIINMSAFAMFAFSIDGHDLEVIEVEGVDTNKLTVQTLELSAAQRYSVLVKAKNTTDTNYLLHADLLPDMFNSIPDGLELNLTATIQYNENNTFGEAYAAANPLVASVVLNDMDLIPLEVIPPFKPTRQIPLEVVFQTHEDGKNYGTFNNRPFELPKNTPTVLSALTLGDQKTNAALYGNAQAYILKHMEVIELLVLNTDGGSHPFHLHGHVFQVAARGELPYNPANVTADAANPLRRDTVIIPPASYVTLRFVADNPGPWLFHCHIEWHLQSGLGVTFIEAPEAIKYDIPQFIKDQCTVGGYGIEGNANGKLGIDMVGYIFTPGLMQYGIFTKGIISLVFCIFSAVVGIITIIWFAYDDIENSKQPDTAEANVNDNEINDTITNEEAISPVV
ncbi:ferroxidase fet3 [Lobulomyces angularis]|nr:ferroxidase fet3 [Lobulomyces angularis]